MSLYRLFVANYLCITKSTFLKISINNIVLLSTFVVSIAITYLRLFEFAIFVDLLVSNIIITLNLSQSMRNLISSIFQISHSIMLYFSIVFFNCLKYISSSFI